MDREDGNMPAAPAGEAAAFAAADEAPEFGYAEHLLLWAWRRITLGSEGSARIGREFAAAFGTDGAEVLAALETFLRALAYAGRRRLQIGLPGDPVVTDDERRILSLIAAAQASRPALFEAQLRWIATPEQRHALAIAAGALATALAANDLHLVPPPREAPSICVREGAVA